MGSNPYLAAATRPYPTPKTKDFPPCLSSRRQRGRSPRAATQGCPACTPQPEVEKRWSYRTAAQQLFLGIMVAKSKI